MTKYLPRCSTCLSRHSESTDCLEPGEEGYITSDELRSAFKLGDGVCLACQSVMILYPGDREKGCPDCGSPWEQFGEDDLEAPP